MVNILVNKILFYIHILNMDKKDIEYIDQKFNQSLLTISLNFLDN